MNGNFTGLEGSCTVNLWGVSIADSGRLEHEHGDIHRTSSDATDRECGESMND